MTIRMRHAIQEGSVPGEGIWILKLPPSDYKRNDAGHFYYFSVEYLDGMSHAPKTLRLGSSNEPFIVKVPADP